MSSIAKNVDTDISSVSVMSPKSGCSQFTPFDLKCDTASSIFLWIEWSTFHKHAENPADVRYKMLMSFVCRGSSSRSSLRLSSLAKIWTSVGKSLAYRHIGPIVRYLLKFLSFDEGKWPSRLMTPSVGLWPKTPLNIPGTRIDPAMSEPRPNTVAPAPFNAPSPPEEPPDVRLASYGFNVRPLTWVQHSQLRQYSGVELTSSGMAPAALSFSTTTASFVAFVPTRGIEPPTCDMPFTAMLSLTVNGTPSRG